MLIVIVVVIMTAIVILLLTWNQYQKGKRDLPNKLHKEPLKNFFLYDAILQRSFLIEIISNKEQGNQLTPAQKITYRKIKGETKELYNSLSPLFGTSCSHKIISLFNKRNHLLKEYYLALAQGDKDEGLLQRSLESISREIIDAIALTSQLHENNQSPEKRLLTQRYQKLFNLLVLYDREVINQSRTYGSASYEISLNSNKSCFDMINHLVEELSSMKIEPDTQTQI